MSEIFIPSIITDINGVDQAMNLPNYDFLKKRKIYINSEISNALASAVCSQIEYLSEKSDEDIILVVNSAGGFVPAGLAIIDSMEASKCDICTVATGNAASMAAVLIAAGTKGKRYASPRREVMIHQPLGEIKGQATDIALVAEHIQQAKYKLAEILANATGKKVRTLINDMERDKWLSAKEAIEYGLIDHVGYPEY